MFCRRRRDVLALRFAAFDHRIKDGIGFVAGFFGIVGAIGRFIDSAASRSSSIEAFSSGVRLFRLAFSTFFRLSWNSCSFSSWASSFCAVVASERNVPIQPTTVLTATGKPLWPQNNEANHKHQQ